MYTVAYPVENPGHLQGFRVSRSLYLLAISICEGVAAIVLFAWGLLADGTNFNYWLFTAVVGLLAVLTYRDRKH